jgi:pimeloyl-ACP methyl ester carboxylesterase/tellurite resistance protein
MGIDPGAKWIKDLTEYWVDAAQRTILFTDILRKRGNVYLDHLHEGQTPVLVFDYETVMDGRTLGRPVNYALVRILDRRGTAADRRKARKAAEAAERRGVPSERRHKPVVAEEAPQATSRPIVIFDPRAGHGPGIGGSKTDSQIGMALDAGHPVYFLIFFTRPMPGQTLADVRNAQIRFVEKVRELHPNSPRPAIIGNCQGGWAAALVGAERPDLVGPMVFNGSPLSYWGGVDGVNPMRYLGGLLGGVWMNSLLSDLGNGVFDGANLVANFENLNPANTLWTKQYNVYANVDTEEARYLNFEKWWGGFFLMTDREIHQIVEGLFIGNKLERGEFELEEGRVVDLKNNDNPVVVFASFGDNITPPQQAFNWIIKAYGTVEEIKRRGQVIVGIGHSRIGHLGIFVSAKIARKEHKEIIASFDMLNYLPPGLYQMQIEEDPDEPGEYNVRYVEKTMDDIMALDDGLEDEAAFFAVRQVSETLDLFYRSFVSPWIRSVNSDVAAEAMRQLHPLRMQRYLFSDLNPWMIPFGAWASLLRSEGRRRPAAADNPFTAWEKAVSDGIADALDRYRDARDAACERMFKAIYENPWMRIVADFAGAYAPTDDHGLEEMRRRDADRWRKYMTEGEFADAVVRVLLAVGLADQELQRDGYLIMGEVLAQSPRMKSVEAGDLRQIVREQSRILQTDLDQAIETLPRLLAKPKDRKDALALMDQAVAAIGRPIEPAEEAVLGRIRAVLGS